MKNIRIGKDISLTWTLTVDGASVDLSELDLTLYLISEATGKKKQITFTADDDVLSFTFYGTEQTALGVHRLTLWLNKGQEGQSVLDESYAFNLVPRTEMEGDTDEDNLTTATVELNGDLTTGTDEEYAQLEARVTDIEDEGLILSTTIGAETISLDNSEGDAVVTLPAATGTTAGVMSAEQVSLLNSKAQVYDFGNDLYEGDITTADYEVLAAKLAKVGSGEYIGTFMGGIAMYYTLSNSTIQIGFLTNDGSDNSVIVFSISRVETSTGYHTITSTTTTLADAANVPKIYDLSYLYDASSITSAQHADLASKLAEISQRKAIAIIHNNNTNTSIVTRVMIDGGLLDISCVGAGGSFDIHVEEITDSEGNHAVTHTYTNFADNNDVPKGVTRSASALGLINGNDGHLFDLPAATTTYAGIMSAAQVTALAGKANVEDVPNSYITDGSSITLQHTDGNDTYDIVTIGAAGAGAGVMSSAQATRLANAALAPTLSVQSTAPATLTPLVNTYTRIDAAVGTMSVTLPAIEAGTFSALSLAFTSDTTPAVTFTTADGKSIVYASDFAIDAETTYEVSALFNGVNWVLAYVTFD